MMIKDAGRNVRYALDFHLQGQKSSSHAASTRYENGRVIDIGTGYEQEEKHMDSIPVFHRVLPGIRLPGSRRSSHDGGDISL